MEKNGHAATYDEVQKLHTLYFNIVKKRYWWFAISLLIIIPGMISFFMQGLNLGIDFKGGTMLDVTFNKAVTQAAITDTMKSVGLEGPVQLSNGDTVAAFVLKYSPILLRQNAFTVELSPLYCWLSNTETLKQLIREVMVRNWRSETGAIAGRRSADMIRIELTPEEQAFYQRLTVFVTSVLQSGSGQGANGRPCLCTENIAEGSG